MGPMNMVFLLFAIIACSSFSTAMPGSPKEIDVNDPYVQQFLTSTLMHVKAPPTGTEHELTTLVRVTKVTFQVVAGIRYTYNFEAKGVKTQKLYSCSLTVVSQPWAEGDVVENFNCLPANLLLRSMVSENAIELKNSNENEDIKTGAPQEKNVNDPLVQQFLASTLVQVKAPPKGTDNELTSLVKVTKVTFQVVSGFKYIYEFEAKGVKTHRMYTCSLTMVSRPWAEGDMVLDHHCQPLSSNLLLRSLKAENGQELNDINGKHKSCAGCPQEHNTEDPFVQEFLLSTMSQVKAPPKGTENELTTLVKVTRVTSQVVSGIMYKFDFEAKGVKTHKMYTCRIVVLSRPWAEGDIVSDFHCQPLNSNLLQSSMSSGNQNAIPGAPTEKNVEDPFVQQFLASTLTHMKAPPKGTDDELTTLIKVTKVTSQVVSGLKYTFDFIARGVKTHKLYNCSLAVVTRPWAEGVVVHNFQCQQQVYSNMIFRN